MLFAKETLCVLLGIWLAVGTHRRLARGQFGRAWQVWFILLTIAGVALAFGLMNIRYLESSTSRAYGVPFVIAGGEFVEGQWRDGGVGVYLPLPALADLAFGVAVCVIPLTVLSVIRSRKNEKESRVA